MQPCDAVFFILLHQSFLLSLPPRCFFTVLIILFPLAQASSSASFSIFVSVAICASWLSLCLRRQRGKTKSLLCCSIKTTSLSHTAALGDMFLRCHEHAQHRSFWLTPTYMLPQILTRAPDVDWSATENSPQQMDYFFLFVYSEQLFRGNYWIIFVQRMKLSEPFHLQ